MEHKLISLILLLLFTIIVGACQRLRDERGAGLGAPPPPLVLSHRTVNDVPDEQKGIKLQPRIEK